MSATSRFARTGSKYVPQRQHDTPVSTVQAPLVQEIGGIDAALWNSEVSGIGGVVELGSELQDLGFAKQCCNSELGR